MELKKQTKEEKVLINLNSVVRLFPLNCYDWGEIASVCARGRHSLTQVSSDCPKLTLTGHLKRSSASSDLKTIFPAKNLSLPVGALSQSYLNATDLL